MIAQVQSSSYWNKTKWKRWKNFFAGWIENGCAVHKGRGATMSRPALLVFLPLTPYPFQLAEHFIHQPVLLGFVGGHEEVALDILLDFFN